METDKLGTRKDRPDPLTDIDRADRTLADHPHADTSSTIPQLRLKPSEALTRFVPGELSADSSIRSMEPVRFGVRVGDIGLLVPAGMHSELVEDSKIYPLPTAPGGFLGLINLRGTLVPVFDLKALFQMGNPAARKTRLLVLNTDERAVGFLIDALPETLRTTRRLAQCPILPTILQEHTLAVYAIDGRVWVEFEFDGFFDAVSGLKVT
jgi:twitching motility protein PilI